MDELESQIAKIQLGNNKLSRSYVYIMAEKAPNSPAELYMVAELPLFNPAAEESCERICLAIASALKRSYRRSVSENSFENAISQINEELAKLASMGQTQWVDRLNCVLSVKEGNTFHIASCGKVAAYLLRNGEFTDISCSPTQSHPLKTFENYASGKIRLGDLVILSTPQLFNHLSLDRLLNIFSSGNFLNASQTLLALLKDNAEPQVSFGVLLNLQIPFGENRDEEVDLENYIVEQPHSEGFLNKALDYVKQIFALGKDYARRPKTNLPKVALGDKLKNLPGNTKNLWDKSKTILSSAKNSAQAASSAVNPQNFKGWSKQKKFFLLSAAVLMIAVVANILIASRVSKSHKQTGQVTDQLNQAEALLSNVQASLLYKDNTAAANYYAQAKAKIPEEKDVPSSQKDLYNKVLAELNDTQSKMEKTVEVKTENLGSLGAGSSLIKLPNALAVQVKNDVISYNLQNGQIQDGALTLSVTAADSAYISGNNEAVYDGKSLYVWDFSAGKTGTGFSQSLAQDKDFGGMAQYPTNNRVYVADKSKGQIVSFLPSSSTFSKPTVSVSNPAINEAVDITIDTSIYVLTPTGISKFTAGSPASFNLSPLAVPFSGQGKIYTQKDFQNLYVLDSGNKRILVFDKQGTLLNTLTSDSFTDLKDFSVDEKNKVIYVLNDGSLLKVTLP